MAKYKVIALSVLGHGNKIWESGQEVTDKDFPQGKAENLVAGGFLKSLDGSKGVKENLNTIEVDLHPEDEKENEEELEEDDKKGKKHLNEITREEIIAYLEEHQVEFKSNDKTKNLHALYVEN